MNLQITASEVRLISEDGADLGVHSRTAALDLVRSLGEDLVEVDPDSTPPVCQVIDYGKYAKEASILSDASVGLPNKPDAANPAIASRFHGGCPRRGVADPER